MSVAVTDYTNSDKIRAVLGVTPNEVSDTKITDMLLAEALTSELDDWLPTHATVYSDGTTGSPTAQQLADWRNLQLYSVYFCASKVNLFQLHVPQSMTNGKDAFKRFEGVDFDELAEQLLAEANQFREKLEQDVNSALAIGRVALFGAPKPGYDPVKDE